MSEKIHVPGLSQVSIRAAAFKYLFFIISVIEIMCKLHHVMIFVSAPFPVKSLTWSQNEYIKSIQKNIAMIFKS